MRFWKYSFCWCSINCKKKNHQPLCRWYWDSQLPSWFGTPSTWVVTSLTWWTSHYHEDNHHQQHDRQHQPWLQDHLPQYDSHITMTITTTIISRCGEKAARQQGFSGAFLQNIWRKKKTVIEMCVGLCSYILRPSETSTSKLWDNFNLFWNFEHTLSSYSMHTDGLTLHTGALILCTSILFWTLRYSYIVCRHTQGPSSSPWKRVARHPRKVHRQATELKRTDCEIFKIWSLINWLHTQTHFLLLSRNPWSGRMI